MKKRMMMVTVTVMLAAVLTACGGNSDSQKNPKSESQSSETVQSQDGSESQEGSGDIVVDSEESELTALYGTPITDAMDKFKELGYTAKYYADGVDFTDFIDDVKDDYTTGEMKIDTNAKTVDVTLMLTSNIKNSEMQNALEEKLNVGTAWVAAEKYGQSEYGSSFDLNYLTGKIDASAEDENTWFLKAECEVNGEQQTCEAKVSGTTSNPEVVSFDVY